MFSKKHSKGISYVKLLIVFILFYFRLSYPFIQSARSIVIGHFQNYITSLFGVVLFASSMIFIFALKPKFIFSSSFSKSQSSLLVFLAIATIVSVTYLSNLYSQQFELSRFLTSEEVAKVTKFLDVIKGLSRNSLILAANKGTLFIAGKGESYICNIPTPPTVAEERNEVGNQTLGILNTYVENINFTEQVLSYNISKYGCVDYPINEAKLQSGQYDEKFNVGAYNGSVNLTIGQNNITSKNDAFELITQNRFWFLYRKFVEWSKASTLSSEICPNLCPQNVCDGVGTAALEKARVLLEQTIGDEFVKCSYTRSCCYQEIGTYNGPKYDGCIKWENPKACPTCYLDRSSDICVNKISYSEKAGENKKF